MKLYKFDYKGTIGNNVITVPTDSQFLIGIGNGDASSTAQLFDGTTEILPEDDKIGEYTCFKMETQGTQFRKPYKAVIGGNNFEDKSLWTPFFEDIDYKGFESIALAIPDNVNVEDLNYESGQAPVLTSFPVYVYGADWITGRYIFHYLETITLTWDASKTAYEIPIDMGGEMWAKYVQFSECAEDNLHWDYGRTSYNDLGDGQMGPDKKEDVPAPIPYIQSIDLFVICKKMSVAYRDETGITASEAVEAVKESGQFLSKSQKWGDSYYIPDVGILMESQNIDINGGALLINSASGEDTYLEAYPNAESEEVMVTGVINAQGGSLEMKEIILTSPKFQAGFFDINDNEYFPTEITVKINGVEKTVLAFVCQNY